MSSSQNRNSPNQKSTKNARWKAAVQRCHSNDEVEEEVSELNRAHDGMQMALLALTSRTK